MHLTYHFLFFTIVSVRCLRLRDLLLLELIYEPTRQNVICLYVIVHSYDVISADFHFILRRSFIGGFYGNKFITIVAAAADHTLHIWTTSIVSKYLLSLNGGLSDDRHQSVTSAPSLNATDRRPTHTMIAIASLRLQTSHCSMACDECGEKIPPSAVEEPKLRRRHRCPKLTTLLFRLQQQQLLLRDEPCFSNSHLTTSRSGKIIFA
jgi:hypothetical protein